MRKSLTALIVIFLVLFGGYYAASPYLKLHQFKQAIDAQDVAPIIESVDFVRVKASVKEQIKTQMIAQSPELSQMLAMPHEPTTTNFEDGFAMMGAMFAVAMVDGLVDTLLTPSMIEMVMQGQELNLGEQAQLYGANPNELSELSSNFRADAFEYDTAYRGLDEFHVTITKPDNQKTTTLVLERDGLFDWKVVDVILPLN
ncbi:DUF2939 domain-containing protein [Moraxella canis]|uniref:DUF2939 domain-containing protein n=1 Tax=Moraxella canis TaxID=90239 RepID=A0A1S9ZQU9_9GAMM|nr:DUF2939 domain-containing protein [Moraxella canis]OOR85401.1 hypothetical protein B0180_00970 [Moraxella canis]